MDAEIRCDKKTRAILTNPSEKKLHQQAKIFSHKKSTFLKRIDEAIGKDDIANVFKDKFCNLYNSVSYNNNEMNVFINDIDKLIDGKCNCGGFSKHGTHSIGAKDVNLSIKRLKPNKKDGISEIVSDHIINACNSLCIYLEI